VKPIRGVMRYYWVVCQSHDEPDGPATLFGPYDYDGALVDIFWNVTKPKHDGNLSGICYRKHVIGWGNELPPQLKDSTIVTYQGNNEEFEDWGREETIQMITNGRKADKEKYVSHEMRGEHGSKVAVF
jgi:hypothetical protein